MAPKWGSEAAERSVNELLGTLLKLHLNIYAIMEEILCNSEKVLCILPVPPSPLQSPLYTWEIKSSSRT